MTIDTYVDERGRAREIVACAGTAGSVLVIDRDASTLGDRRLVAHLAPDEPPSNAAVVARCYLADESRGRARRVTSADVGRLPTAHTGDLGAVADEIELVDRSGCRYRLGVVPSGAIAIPELRWLREPPAGHEGAAEMVSLRAVIGRLEDYEPAREVSERAVHAHRGEAGVSVATLRGELDRVGRSRIVLNRALREAVVRTIAREGLSMSAIATRCGRIKRDRRGNVSGETSWLARRVGLVPEGGEQRPTPWIHSDVLALIARAGLGIPPREVELG